MLVSQCPLWYSFAEEHCCKHKQLMSFYNPLCLLLKTRVLVLCAVSVSTHVTQGELGQLWFQPGSGPRAAQLFPDRRQSLSALPWPQHC